jgi:hypothetical protein
MRMVEFTSADEMARFDAGTLHRSAEISTQIEQHHADEHIMAMTDNQGAAAECSLWWSRAPRLEGEHVGLIGHYSAMEPAAAHAVLELACQKLKNRGCTLAIGPMDGTTWNPYRFVTGFGEEPPFFLEPQNPPDYPEQFVAAGFSPLAQYFSALNIDLSVTDPRLEEVEQRLAGMGVKFRQLKSGELSDQLPRIYHLCRVAFKENYLYTELSGVDFTRQYQKIMPLVRPELVLVVEQQGELVGFSFSIPDALQQSRGVPVDTFLIKTIAVLPGRDLRGLGSLLVAKPQQIGHELGFKRCIHALMHENNKSRSISRHYAQTMRRYTLYGRDLRA